MQKKKHIDLTRVCPAIYSPYQYFGIGEKLGEMGQWKERYPNASDSGSNAEKAR